MADPPHRKEGIAAHASPSTKDREGPSEFYPESGNWLDLYEYTKDFCLGSLTSQL